jgi:hypothetical protein
MELPEDPGPFFGRRSGKLALKLADANQSSGVAVGDEGEADNQQEHDPDADVLRPSA